MKHWIVGQFVGLALLLFPVTAVAAAATPVPLGGTTWNLPGTSRVSVQGAGAMNGKGNLRLTFANDGTFYLEDDSGAGFGGTYADNKGKLSTHILPQSIEDFVYSALGTDLVTLTVNTVDMNLQVSKARGAPVMKVTLGFTASLSYYDPNTHKTVHRKMTYHANASGPQS